MKTSIPKLHSVKWKNGLQAENVHVLKNMDISVNEVLKGVISRGLYEIVVFGYDKDGKEYIAGSSANNQRSAYMFARGHLQLLRWADA